MPNSIRQHAIVLGADFIDDQGRPRERPTSMTRFILALAISTMGISLLSRGTMSAEASEQGNNIGRFVTLGVTEAAHSWKSSHPSDTYFLYRLDSATGSIEICEDIETACHSIPSSERDAKGFLVGRFAGLKIVSATAAWKWMHPSDEYLMYSLDSTSGQIQVCGNVEGACALVAGEQAVIVDRWPKVVMLYRRADSAAIAGRIYDRFVAHYGSAAVFMDIYGIPLATDWRDQVRNMSLHGGVVVALIGPRWAGPRPDGGPRIQDNDDPVRTEIETALKANVPIFPLLVEGSTMPKAVDLPDSLKEFSNINAATVDSGRDFDPHVARLIESIDNRLGGQESPTIAK